MQQKISAFNLEENITMRGEVSHADVLELMQQTKIFLHPSSYEGFSMVCLEALYAGCHVISFCKPMKRDFSQWHIVKNKNEMVDKTLKILLSPGTKYERIFPYSIQQTTASLMKLFGY